MAGKRGASCKYLVMSLDELKMLPVRDISADDSVLFLWTTMPMLPEALELIPAWGYNYKTCAFTWVKRNKKSDGWFWGMGNWTRRANAELCLLATRGSPKRISASVHSLIDDRIMKHSKKPDDIRQRIVTLMGDLPRIELFARERSEGWDVWGNEM